MKRYLIILALVFLTPCLTPAQAVLDDPIDGTYIVLLKAPSVVQKVLERTPRESRTARRQILFSSVADDYRVSLEQSQLRTIQALTAAKPVSGPAGSRMSTAPRITVLDRRSFLLNMLVVTCSAEKLHELRRHPDVKAVYPTRKRRLHMDSVPGDVAVTAVWEMLGGISSAGQGIRIGIIDSGINQAHPMFHDSGIIPPAGFPRPAEFSAYTNSKVIVARDYVKPQYGYADQAVHSPEDERGHGTAVASVAAGVAVTTPYLPLQGMAPKAFLGNYKVFGRAGVNDDARTDAIIAAIEDAVKDEMDVINLSLGGLAQSPETDPEQQAIAEATEAGVLVVISAGNEGPNAGTISSPGTSPQALTVGATLHSRYFAAGMNVTSSDAVVPSNLSLVAYVSADGQTVSSAIGPVPLASILPYDPTGQGCSPLPAGSLNGKMALVSRGNCLFADKAVNAINAGAAGIVVYQNQEEPPLIMSGVDFRHRAVMIEKGAGDALQSLLPGHSISVTLRPESETFKFLSKKDQIASFSSRGPDILYQLKPDIVAPGQDILAAGAGNGYTRGLNGTSFSAPVVTGAAALMFQLHPTWTPQNVKSSLVNSADPSPTWHGEPARVIDTGNGRLNVEKAAAISALLDPVSVSFGVIEQAPGQDLEKVVRVSNPSTTVSQTLSAELIENGPHPCVQLSVTPLALTLGPGQSGEFTVKARILQPLQYGTFEGYLRLTSSTFSTPANASYWGAVLVEDRSQLLKVSKDGSTGYSSIPAAVVNARPGATVEIQDSDVYSDPLTIATNVDGLPLHGLTLKARTGRFPILRFNPDDPGVVLSGVERVTLDGLTIELASYGVYGSESSGTITNTLIDSSGYGFVSDTGRFSLRNTTITRSRSAGLIAFDSLLNLADTTIQQNGEEGAVFVDSPALIQRSFIGQNKREGIFGIGGSLGLFESTVEKNQATAVVLFETPGVLKRALIKDTTGQDPDGIYAYGDISLTVQESQILNNGRHGLAADLGPHVQFLRNQVADNRSLGFYLSLASGNVESSWLTGNGRGIRAESSALDVSNSVISNSTDFTNGDGIYADQGSLSVLNTTIAKNQRKGLRIIGAEHVVANSILHQNSGGDLEGGDPGSVHFNFISEGVFAGLNGNQQIDPRFTDIVKNDFSLTQASPAIDAASPDFPTGWVDALGLERAIDGNNDGVAQSDIGALEYNSKNWLPLILPVLSSRTDEFVGLAMVNSSDEIAHVELTGFDLSGSQVGAVYKKDVAAGSQFSILLTQAVPSLKQGWIRITTDKPDLMSFSLLGKAGLTQMDGAELSSATSSKLLFPEIRALRTSDTQLYVVNPGARQVEVDLTFHTPTKSSTQTFTIKANGSLAQSVYQTFGSYTGNGYVTIEAKDDSPLFAMAIFSNGQSIAGLLGLDMTQPRATLFGAQLASNNAVETILSVVNLGTTPADITFEAFDETGTLVKSVVSRVAAGQLYRKPAKEIFGLTADLVGWARIRAADGRLLGCLTFSDTTGGFMASLPLQALGSREFVLGHVAQTDEVFTGVTLLNAGAEYAEVSVEVLDKTGVSKGLALFDLKPNEKRARLLTEYIPSLAKQEGGFVRVRSSSPIFGFELFGHNQLRFMSAVPQQVVVY